MKTINDLIIKLNETISNRFESIEAVNLHIGSFIGLDIKFQEATSDSQYDDYRIIANVILDDETDLYIDLYYTKSRLGFMYITEFSLDGEHCLDDYTKRISHI
jgi:hypothetical protein